MRITTIRPRTVLYGVQKTEEIAAVACCAAARGAAHRLAFVPRSASGTSRATGASISVFALPGL